MYPQLMLRIDYVFATMLRLSENEGSGLFGFSYVL